jgi:hypothetical protein
MGTTDNGVRYLIHKIGTPQFRNDNGKLAPSGDYWHGIIGRGGYWGDKAGATCYALPQDKYLPDGGEWVAVFLNVSVNGDVG